MKNPKSILITGVSSGIGETLTLRYAVSGVTLHPCGRDRERLGDAAARGTECGSAASPSRGGWRS